MIGRLVGHVVSIQSDRCLIDVNGVGYIVSASNLTLAQLPSPPEKAILFIETMVREDAIQLFGFAADEEQRSFRLLTTVQGVGSKVALAILSVHPPEKLALIIKSADKSQLARAAGVGSRLASRIISELSTKMAGWPEFSSDAAPKFEAATSGIEEDAVAALESLGFRRVEIYDVVRRIIQDHSGMPLEKILGLTLKELGR